MDLDGSQLLCDDGNRRHDGANYQASRDQRWDWGGSGQQKVAHTTFSRHSLKNGKRKITHF